MQRAAQQQVQSLLPEEWIKVAVPLRIVPVAAPVAVQAVVTMAATAAVSVAVVALVRVVPLAVTVALAPLLRPLMLPAAAVGLVVARRLLRSRWHGRARGAAALVPKAAQPRLKLSVRWQQLLVEPPASRQKRSGRRDPEQEMRKRQDSAKCAAQGRMGADEAATLGEPSTEGGEGKRLITQN